MSQKDWKVDPEEVEKRDHPLNEIQSSSLFRKYMKEHIKDNTIKSFEIVKKDDREIPKLIIDYNLTNNPTYRSTIEFDNIPVNEKTKPLEKIDGYDYYMHKLKGCKSEGHLRVPTLETYDIHKAFNCFSGGINHLINFDLRSSEDHPHIVIWCNDVEIGLEFFEKIISKLKNVKEFNMKINDI